MSITGDVPREKLKELVAKHGDSLVQDPDRCEGLLKDHCGVYRREISALVGALEERVPAELKSSWQTAMTPEAMRARLVQRLEENRGLAPEVASWAVDAWSYALGVGLARRSDRVDGSVAAVPGTDGAASAWAAPRGAGPGIPERVAGDRVGGAVAQQGSLPVVTSPAVQLSTPKKAGIGAAALLVVGIGAFAVVTTRHSATPPNPTPAPAPAPTLGPTPPGPTPPAPTPDPKPPDNIHGPGGDGHVKKDDDGTNKDLPVQPPKFLPSGTMVAVHLNGPINSDNLNVGDLVNATVSSPVTTDGNVVVAIGARAQLKVTALDRTAKEGGSEHLELELVDLTTEKGPVHVTATAMPFDGPAFHATQVKRGGIGAAAGAVGGFVMGKIFHHGGTGATAGAGGGGAIGGVVAKPGPVKVAFETPIQFRLTASVKAPPQTTAKR